MDKRERAVVALGTFDGMHKGHTELIRRTAERAKAEHAQAAVFAFANHPLDVLGKPPRLLSTPQARFSMISALGAEVVAEPFTRAFADISPDAFIDLLEERWHLVSLLCGFNYTYGAKGAGNAETLRAAGRTRAFDVEVLPPVLDGNRTISSTAIRQAVENGDMLTASEMLGRPYQLYGPVVPNLQNGRRIGFPTANIEWDARLVLPKNGVYRTEASVCGKTYPAVTNVGANPTLHAKKETVETHLIGFSGELYGETVAVSFLEYLRGEVAFDSLEALQQQIAKDVASVTKEQGKEPEMAEKAK